MKPVPFHSSVPALAQFAAIAVACALLLKPACGQPPLDLDSKPSFDFGGDPMSEPVSSVESHPFWQYTLLSGSRLIDDCPICGRMPIVVQARGKFDLRLIQQNPLYASYAIESLVLEGGASPGAVYKLRGKGVYHPGGEVGLLQDMFLELEIDNGATNALCRFTNSTPAVTRGWPIIQITVDQTNGTDVQQYRLELTAAPLREIWFSTAHDFTPGVKPSPASHVQAGDVLSSGGRLVKSNQELASRLGMMPSPKPSDLGLDALDILPGGEIAFSTEVDLFSETLGPLQHGDLLSDQDRVVRSLTDLIAPFDPMPPIADPGLDAVQVLDSGEVWFSVETEFFSQQLGVTIQRGDLLSSAGRIVKTGQELLARFHPPPIPTDFGLDAFHLWPGGEVWFSLEEGFDDSVLGHIGSGDLLSDSGEVVYRNLELLRGFQPLEKMADFGLDALYIVSDAQAQTLAGGRCMQTHLDPATGDLTMSWETKGRLHQLEKAVSVEGPWLPLGPITSELLFTDPGAITSGPQAFYRLREW